MSTPSTPRPSGSAPKSEAPRPTQVKRPAPTGTGSRPAAAGAKPAAGQARPAGARPAAQRPANGQERLVRPAPKAKVRKARLLVSKVEPFSVLKLAFLLSVAFGVITVVAAVGIWALLDLMGTFDAFNTLIRDAMAEGGFDLRQSMSLGQVASYATIIAVVNVVVISIVSMLGAVLYNIAASLVGGIGVTLTDD
ncbi:MULTISPECIES: DUF3566 domain-containing protein [Glutamicibacter]|uniref:DUF3566 domain-containing protein n=1 Tax=Glutamicibacter halophytocola TaxID=1933880 RepID=A0A5B8IML5_9MICC|nr:MULTISPECIES: DUF3566 domain-containing protein [Glutamicibacter]ALG27553.1 hypothetical protein AOZ07_00035 [Glutamicibacter halophytocola]MBF6673079.1 DUF3566 domain-containing protein [Glutamicibacter sp. FBE19]NQD40686.1 DUF3566 domain-containing protein [Glutamicibacter halophytocola]QDY66934.1 DUF3566 domain-containing protein [Glutamicibacter halophytocola]UUX59080.1 DUF3566 domain-containing protein [Glutamicibacter halophytocola]